MLIWKPRQRLKIASWGQSQMCWALLSSCSISWRPPHSPARLLIFVLPSLLLSPELGLPSLLGWPRLLPWLSAESTIQWVWPDSFIFRFFHGTGSVYITAQRRLFLCTCLHVLVLKFVKPSCLGECLHSTCEPLIDEDKSPVSESWGKHSITNWSFNEGHPWKERDGEERSCGVWEIQ